MQTQKNIMLITMLAGVVLVVCTFTTTSLLHSFFVSVMDEEVPPYSVFEETPEKDKPTRLRIDSIAVDAHVQHVGVTKSGKMAVPNNYVDVGWYRYGTVPGEKGSAVVDGHVDNALGLSGVFKRLSELQVGDEIKIETSGGNSLIFFVVAVESYSYKEVPLERLFHADDKTRLNLITCDGAWIQGEKTYDRRLVVFAELRDK